MPFSPSCHKQGSEGPMQLQYSWLIIGFWLTFWLHRHLNTCFPGQLEEYRAEWPSTRIGRPGRSDIDHQSKFSGLNINWNWWQCRLQGLNTGVVLYHLERMRESWLYNSYLHPEAVDHLMERLVVSGWAFCFIVRYHLKMSVGDQDWFTALRSIS